MSGKPTVGLTPHEADIVALHLASRFLKYDEEWLLWEDHPHFGQFAWEGLMEAVERLSLTLLQRAAELERLHDIDGRLILEQAA